MSIANMRKLGSELVVNDKVNRQYTLVFEGSSIDGCDNSLVIPVKSRREVELFLLSLGEEAGVFMDEHARQLYPEVWDGLSGRTYAEVLADLKWSYPEEDEFIDIIERIPLPRIFNDNSNKSFIGEQLGRINQEYVHKIHNDCVLISKPYRCGNMFYFNGLKTSSEFNIDHSSDHLEGIIIFEAARQAGIASVHLTGVPLSEKIVILKTVIRYTKFVDCSESYLIRVIPAIKQRCGYSFGVYNIIQKDCSCSTGYIAGIVYKTKETYQKFRNLKSLSVNEIYIAPS